MKNGVFLFLVLYAVERVIETFWKRTKSEGIIVARYSLPLILSAYVFFYLVIFWEWSRLAGPELRPALVMIGMFAVIASVVGRNWAIKTLGVYHSIHVEIRDRHQLIQSGPYRYVRNPYYLSNAIEAMGLLLVVRSRVALLTVVFVYIPLLVHRLLVEENALNKKFDGLFDEYTKHVPRIVPKLRSAGTN